MTQWVGCDKDCEVVSCDFCVIPAANACWRHCRLSWHEAALTRHNQKTPMASQSARHNQKTPMASQSASDYRPTVYKHLMVLSRGACQVIIVDLLNVQSNVVLMCCVWNNIRYIPEWSQMPGLLADCVKSQEAKFLQKRKNGRNMWQLAVYEWSTSDSKWFADQSIQ